MITLTSALYGMAFAITLVLLGMCGMMYFRWKTELYRGLFGALGLAVFAMLGLVMIPDKWSPFYLFFLSLNECGFIVIQIAMFRLLHTKRSDKLYVHLVATGCTVLVAACSLFLPPQMTALLLLFIICGLSLYSKYKLFADVSLPRKNSTALACYILHITSYTIATMVNIDWILIVSLLFMSAAFYMICMQLFERIIHIMQAAAYTSTRDDITGLYTRKHFLQQAGQLLERKHAHGIIFILLDFTKEKNTGIPIDDSFRDIGPIIHKYCDRYGIACRYEQEGVAVIVTKASMELPNLCDSLKLNIEAEISNGIATGYIEIEEGTGLNELLERARDGAVRMRENGLDKIFEVENSRILY